MLGIFLLHSLASQLKLVLSLKQHLLPGIQGLCINLRLLAEVLKLGLHLQFFALNTLLFLLLLELGCLLLFLELLARLLHELNVFRLLALKFFLLVLVALFLDALLGGHLTEFKLIECHVPVDALVVLVLLLPRIVAYTQTLRVIGHIILKALLLNQLPGKLILILLSELAVRFVVEVGTGFFEGFKRAAQFGVLEDVDASCE